MKKNCFLICFICVLLDQISKYLIISNLEINSSITIIKNVLNFTYIENSGVAFGLFNDLTYLIIIFTVLIFFILTKELKDYFYSKFIVMSYSLIIGGLIGNLIDRVVFKSVRDFIEITFINFPIFNLSDIFIVIGTCFLIIYFIKQEVKDGKNKINEGKHKA